MASRAYEEALGKAKRTLWTVWGVMVGTVPLFGLIGFASTNGSEPVSLPSEFQVVLYTAAGVMGVLAIAVPRLLLQKHMIMEHVRGGKPRESRTSGAFFSPGATVKGMPAREERLVSLSDIYFKPFVYSLAYGEMVAVLGLVYMLVSAQQLPFLIFAGLSVGVQLFNRPALDELIRQGAKYIPEERAPPPTAWPT